MNKIYGVNLSPFVKKVLLTLEYKNVSYEMVNIFPGSMNSAFRKISPLGKIPVFEDEYITTPESSVICQYLEKKYPSPSLIPNSAPEQAKVLWLEKYSDSKLTELLGSGLFFELLVAPKLMRRPADHKKVRQTLKLLPKVLHYLERQITASNFLVGNQLSLADISINSTFINASYADYIVDAKLYPKLSRYLQNMWDFPLFKHRLKEEKETLLFLKP